MCISLHQGIFVFFPYIDLISPKIPKNGSNLPSSEKTKWKSIKRILFIFSHRFQICDQIFRISNTFRSRAPWVFRLLATKGISPGWNGEFQFFLNFINSLQMRIFRCRIARWFQICAWLCNKKLGLGFREDFAIEQGKCPSSKPHKTKNMIDRDLIFL